MADLKAAAKAALDYNEHINEVHATVDGCTFANKNDAVNHAVKLSEKTVSTFGRSENTDTEVVENTPVTEKQYALNGTATIKLINDAESEDAVKQILADDERKTVIAAADKRIAILKEKALTDQAAAADAAKEIRQTENPNNADATGDQNPIGNE